MSGESLHFIWTVPNGVMDMVDKLQEERVFFNANFVLVGANGASHVELQMGFDMRSMVTKSISKNELEDIIRRLTSLRVAMEMCDAQLKNALEKKTTVPNSVPSSQVKPDTPV